MPVAIFQGLLFGSSYEPAPTRIPCELASANSDSKDASKHAALLFLLLNESIKFSNYYSFLSQSTSLLEAHAARQITKRGD